MTTWGEEYMEISIRVRQGILDEDATIYVQRKVYPLDHVTHMRYRTYLTYEVLQMIDDVSIAMKGKQDVRADVDRHEP